ncbi:helix-turn-helix domain containing protein [Thiothrix subterranea]|uniref:helix-turn-helix domain-containing protein n=1 Tax=Thiothrix subterranea TaxID=2735563 RepID=UPI00192AB9A7|nr:helix-turn-helix domain-containing protein [Thiothrix subterranea]QQZ29522.1 helix-turn-helix domain containing protein [Thiothrix subterranea]
MNNPTFRCRQRAQAILLSVRGFTLIQLWSILDVRRDAISEWITRWEEGLIGLYDRPRSGCPPIYTETEVELLKTLVDEEPRQIKTAQTKLADMTQKVASYLWKRMRKSLKDKRDPVAFKREQETQAFLHQQVAAGKLLI